LIARVKIHLCIVKIATATNGSYRAYLQICNGSTKLMTLLIVMEFRWRNVHLSLLLNEPRRQLCAIVHSYDEGGKKIFRTLAIGCRPHDMNGRIVLTKRNPQGISLLANRAKENGLKVARAYATVIMLHT